MQIALPDRDSPAYAAALVNAQMRKIAKARQDKVAFFEYVIREETSRERVVCLPHQRLVLQFVQHYPQSVLRMPVGASKTYLMSALTMDRLGEDPTSRGAIVSGTTGQAQKPLAMVRDYIERSAELRAVYPRLQQSSRDGDPWTQTAITVERPFGIRDPSVVAVGVGGKIPGARLSWIIVDDILDNENTRTPEQRKSVKQWFGNTVLSRLDIQGGARIVVSNTPWVLPTSEDEGDLTYVLQAAGWPTLEINVWGQIRIWNAPDFDSDEIRPASAWEDETGPYRLTAHDDPKILTKVYGDEPPPSLTQDVDEVVTFWPDRFTRERVLEIKAKSPSPADFSQNYEMIPKSASQDKLKEDVVIAAKTEGRRLGHHGFYPSRDALQRRIFDVEDRYAARPHDAPNYRDIIIATGVDLGIGKKQSNARTVFFTIAILPPDNRRLILDIQAGRWSGKEIVAKAIAIHEAYGSILRVENNAAQDYMRQWILDKDKSVPVKAHTTGKNKADPTMGVETIFTELENGGWVFPCGVNGKSPPLVGEWIQDLRQYQPYLHTGDILMASWFADFQAKKMGANLKAAKPGQLAAIVMR